MPYTYDYPRPAVTVDIIVLRNKMTEVLLIKRLNPPYENQWALPGGFLDMDETLEEAAIRELNEETGLAGIPLFQFHAFSAPYRDPRHRTVTIVFYGIIESRHHLASAGSDAKDVAWFKLNAMPPLAFDHGMIMEMAAKKLFKR